MEGDRWLLLAIILKGERIFVDYRRYKKLLIFSVRTWRGDAMVRDGVANIGDLR